jgi:ABC-type multidrug transport system ATPase subunit
VDLRKTYTENNLQAVCGNTFGIKKGEIFGLLGPNGAGKSTTFSMMCLDIAKTSGEA